jgi:lipoteichoic acid synthase
MEPMKSNLRHLALKLSAPSQNFIALAVGLLSVFFFMRIYEFIAVAGSHSLASPWIQYFFIGIAYDVLFVITIAAIMAVPFLLFSLWNLKVSRGFFALISTLILVLHLGLISYYATTNVPLGADFYGYSWNELNLTVRSSAGITFWTFVPFMLFMALAATIFIFTKRIRVSESVLLPVFMVFSLILLLRGFLSPTAGQFQHEADFNLVVNKSDFFLEKSWSHYVISEEITHSAFSSYPMYRTIYYSDVLGKFFKRAQENPNLVFIIVEGLGRDFTGEGARYGGFTPFIDSLMQCSLYWENFLSTGGRTFNVLPSEFGSLPYGANGFMELGGQMPAHQTLISILKRQGYSSNFFYGGNANFDLQDVFLERQGIDFILDENQFGDNYRHADANEKGSSWGYDDGDVFTRSLDMINSQNKTPRLDIYLTLTTHEPFSPPNKYFYWKRVDEHSALLSTSEEKKKIYHEYKEVFGSLLYFDDALRQFFTEYRKRSDFGHTIFFITGDHRLIPVPLADQIDRFHVPFIIYSPLLQEPRKFSSISTHSDVAPTVLGFLHSQYHVDVPEKASWLSSGIDTAQAFRNIHSLPLMRNKNELIDYIDGPYYLAGNQIYKLNPDLMTEKIENDSIQSALQQKLNRFKEINKYVCEHNRLIPETRPNAKNILFTPHDDSTLAALHLENDPSEQLYERARTAAFSNRYEEARAICRWILRKNPRYTDVRILYGHTYAWEKNYEVARSIFKEVLSQMPDNTDALSALIDLELWSGNNQRALFLCDSSLAHHSKSDVLLIRKSRALINLGRNHEATMTLQTAIQINPGSDEARALKKQLGLSYREKE